jgi:hypothetical protein
MNERIKELYTQALENKFDYGGGRGVKSGEYYSNYKTVLNAEKFAELIVRECIQVVDGMADPEEDSDRYVWALHNASEKIKQHFGVEE